MSRRTSSHVFVGRRAELGRLDDALDEASAGRPSIQLVAGEAGIGKTRFVSEFIARSEAAGARAAIGGCLDVADGGLPYAPFVEAFRALARDVDPATRPELFGASGDLGGFMDASGRSASSPAVQRTTALDEPTQRLARLFDGVIGTLGRLSADQPVVLVLEDLHWADGSTRDLIRFLARNIREERLLVVATYRSDDLHRRHPVMPLLAELARAERVDRIDLRRFDRAEVDELLTGMLGEPPSPTVSDALHTRSDGLPFYVEQLLAASAGDGVELPSSLRDILDRRLADLSPDALRVVRTASVVGARCSHDLLATASGLDAARLLAALHELADGGILVAGDDAEGPAYTFHHALLREAAYDDLLPAERVRLHGELADMLEASIRATPEPGPAMLADFASHAYLAHDLPRALEGACRAMSACTAAVAYREALTHAERALELWPRVPDAARRAGIAHSSLLADAGRLAAAASQPARAIALLQDAIADLGGSAEVSARVALLAELQAASWEAEAYDVSRTAAETAYELGATAEPSPLMVDVLAVLSSERWWSGHLREAVSLLERAMTLAEELGDGSRWAESAALLAHVRSDLGQGVWASVLIDRTAAAQNAASDMTPWPAELQGRAYWRIGSELDQSLAALTCGRFADAEHYARRAFEQVSRYGLEARHGPHVRGSLLDALFELGRYDEAEAVARQVRHGEGIAHAVNWLAATMSRVATAQGRFDDAHQRLAAAPIDPLLSGSAPSWDPFAYLRVARLDLARAEGRFPDVVAITTAFADAIPTTEAVMPAWQVLGIGVGGCADEVARAGRRRRAADDVTEHAERWLAAYTALDDRLRSEGGGGPWFDTTLATAAAEMGRLRDRDDPAAWAAVVDGWTTLQHPFQAAYGRLRHAGAILRTGGDRPAADEALRAAYQSATSIGAGRLLPEIKALAAAARIDLEPDGSAVDVPPIAVDPHVAGPAAVLTPREAAVLRLVADGHTNREIGGQLFMSEKTASVHVSHAMAKLGALSRYEAAAAAVRQGLLDP